VPWAFQAIDDSPGRQEAEAATIRTRPVFFFTHA
jgi:hypothetical protein